MAIVASQLVAKVSADGVEQTKAELTSVGTKNDEIQKKINDGLKFAALGGIALFAAAGIAAVKMAGDFQSEMTSLVTGAGESEKNLKMVSDGILKMAVDTGTSTQQLSAGMYLIESAGFHGAAGLDVLAAASRGAKVGNADLAVVANGVTTIMVDYASKNITASQATNILIAAVAAGKTHMQDLASAMASVLPTASAVGVKIIDVSAAMATMTAEGTPAADAATYLRQMLLALEVPGSKAVKTFKEIGLSTADVAAEMKVSLPGALQMITDALAKKFPVGSAAYVSALKDMAGGQKNFQAWLELTGQHLQTFQNDVAGITKTVAEGGTTIQGWGLVQDDFNFKLDKVRSTVEVLAIRFGIMLLPELGKLLDYVQGQVIPQLVLFSDWFQKNGIPAIDSFAQQLGPLVGHLADFVKWIGEGTPPARILTGAVIGLGIAIATVKIAGLVSDMGNFIIAVPEMLGKMLLVQGGAAGIATAETGVGVAATTTAAEVSTASAGMSLSFAGVALAIAPLVLAAKYLVDNRSQIIDTLSGVKDLGKGVTNNGQNTGFAGNWWQQMNQQQADAIKQAAQDAKDLQTQINKAWADMASLADFATSHQRILGDITDPIALSKADVQLQETKSHLDDLAKPYEPKIITADIEKGRLKIIEFKSRIDDVKGPVNVGVLTPQVEAGRLKIIEFKSRIDDVKGPVNVGVLTPDIVAGRLAAIDLKSHLDDLKGPFTPSIGTRSITDAIVNTMVLKSHLDDLSATVSIPIAYGGGSGGHASGILNNPVGHWAMVGERGPEPMYVPRGASILPSGTMPPASSGSTQPINVNVYLDGAPVAKKLMPHIAQQIRVATGATF